MRLFLILSILFAAKLAYAEKRYYILPVVGSGQPGVDPVRPKLMMIPPRTNVYGWVASIPNVSETDGHPKYPVALVMVDTDTTGHLRIAADSESIALPNLNLDDDFKNTTIANKARVQNALDKFGFTKADVSDTANTWREIIRNIGKKLDGPQFDEKNFSVNP